MIVILSCAGCNAEFLTRIEENNSDVPRYDHVYIIGVDGAGSFFDRTNTPFFDSIFSGGNVSYSMKTPAPTNSAEGWGSMFYGINSEVHGIKDEIAKRKRFFSSDYHSYFRVIKESRQNLELAAIVAWYPITYGILDLEPSEMYYYPTTPIENDLNNDEVYEQVEIYLRDNIPDCLFIHLNDVDEAGHKYGWGTKEYYSAIENADEYIGRIHSLLAQKGLLDNALFIVTSDHGGTGKGTHGGDSIGETESMFAISGPGIVSEEIQEMEIQDVAAIVLKAFGIDIPDYYTARIPKGIWDGVGGGLRREANNVTIVSPYRQHNSDVIPDNNVEDIINARIIYKDCYETGDSIALQGYFGSAGDMSNHHNKTNVTFSDLGKTFSVMFWIKPVSIVGDPLIICNKDWISGENTGMAIALRKELLIVNLADENKTRNDFKFPLPSDFEEGWTHFIISFDFNQRIITGYCDFTEIYSDRFSETISLDKIGNGNYIIVGQDSTEEYKWSLNAIIDELYILDRALTVNEIEKIRDYYTL